LQYLALVECFGNKALIASSKLSQFQKNNPSEKRKLNGNEFFSVNSNNEQDEVPPSFGDSQSIECFLPTPNPDIRAEEIIPICLTALQENNSPSPNAGLEVNFNFSSDRCRAALGGDLKAFIQYAKNPTFGTMINCSDWEILNVGPSIPGTATRGAMKTVLVKVTPMRSSEDGSEKPSRKFLWTLQKERRPPRANCWLIHEVIYTKNAFSLTF